MNAVTRSWGRAPVVARAVVSGLAVAAAGTVPWAMLVSANMRAGSSLPWAVPVMAGYLWLFWRYTRGAWWPASTAAARHANARANTLAAEVWGPALMAGMLGLVSVLLFQGVLGRLVALPQQERLDISRFPLATVLVWLAMSAVVAGVVEETAFRGYLQRPIERRFRPLTAILVSGLLFAFAHFTHPEVGLVLLPFYVSVAAVYGMLAYLTDSTLPSMVLHAGGNLFSAAGLFAGGRSEWELAVTPAPLVWHTGLDAAFVGTVLGLLVVGAATVWAYVALAHVSRAAVLDSSPDSARCLNEHGHGRPG